MLSGLHAEPVFRMLGNLVMLSTGIIQMAVSGLRILSRDRRAVTSVEYALIALLIALAIVGSVSKIGPELAVSFNSVASKL